MRSYAFGVLLVAVLVVMIAMYDGSLSSLCRPLANSPVPASLSLAVPGSSSSSASGVRGRPSVTVDVLNRVLSAYHSPAVGLGQALYDDGLDYSIDPVFALAFFMHESSFGTAGVATVTHSLGNIRCTPGYSCYEGYRWYARWQDGALDWYRLLATEYVPRGLVTVETIVPVYAPSSDHNNVDCYIASVKAAVATWRAGQVWVKEVC
jgi:hypothetical protein